MSSPLDARSLATKVLVAVLDQGMFAAATLDRVLRGHPDLDPRDRALTTELVYGTLRTLSYLERELLRFAPRGLPAAGTAVRVHLLIATYQMLFLSRVPNFAAVNVAVSAIAELAGPKVAGFSNAVLRKVSALPAANLNAALQSSAPSWLLHVMQDSVGTDATHALLGCRSVPRDHAFLTSNNALASKDDVAFSEVTPTCVRLRRGVAPPEWLQGAQRGRVYPDAYLLYRAGNLQASPDWQQGDYVVQEEGAMLCASALAAKPGHAVLDVCAGRGQKSSLIAERIGPTGTLWVTDNAEHKLDALSEEFSRLHLPTPHSATVDWMKGAPDHIPKGYFDKILVDAPCSGTGTLRRRPEIALRLSPKDIARLANNAERILRNVASYLKPGGSVLFVVCSVLRQECEEVVDRVSNVYRLTPFDAELSLLAQQGEGMFRLLPHEHGTDGFFLANLERL
jgi:16S rRNA (cytosine967-C5)-methyltransferase